MSIPLPASIPRSGAETRPSGGDGSLAIDLGSGRTLVHSPGHRLWINEPTIVGRDSDGMVIGTGRRALAPDVKAGASQVKPVQHGRVVDPVGCVRLLSDIFGRFGVDGCTSVRLAIPTNATPYDVSVLSSVVFSATGSAPEPVPSLLAGAAGAGLFAGGPVLVADLGVGLFEVGVVLEGKLVSGVAAEFGARDYRQRASEAMAAGGQAVDEAIAAAPAAMRAVLRSEPIHLIGGEARTRGFADDLSVRTGRPVVVHGDAGYAVAIGLLRVAEQPPRMAAS